MAKKARKDRQMTYYKRDNIADGKVLSTRRPTINEFFLSSYVMSVYNGCEIGCPYCDGWVYSPRAFSEVIGVPLDLPQHLAKELQTIDRGDVVAITALSDPYQPAEKSYRITRQVLQLFAEVGQPCVLMTKSPAVLEDVSLLQRIHERSLAMVVTTLLTVDHALSERLEATAPVPALRLDMISALKRAGIPVGVALVPVIPYVNDTEYATRRLLRTCLEKGADFVIWDYLHMSNPNHRARIQDMLTRVGYYPENYYQEIYSDAMLPNVDYRAERSREILTRCDSMGIQPHAPHSLYAGRISRRNEAALLLKHAAFRNALNSQHRMAALHRELSDLAYRGDITAEQLQGSPLWKKVQPLLNL
jgi:DNA repair photolyase